MGNLPEPSNEQKLTFIYKTLKAQEARRKRGMFIVFLKWLLLISFINFLYVYRVQIFERSYTYVADNINERLRRISEEQKSGILKGIQQLLPPSLEDTLKDVQKIILSGTGDLIPALNQSGSGKNTTTKPTTKKSTK